MSFYNNYPFYCGFFTDLGIKIVLSDITTKETMSRGSSLVVTETCLPIKVYVGHVLNLLDKGVDKNKIAELYPVLSGYNETNSPNIQTFLAGIYRKTKIPDAFGPLVKMLIKDSINPQIDANFDPTEEIGGAILDYIA